jgi:MFS family permease
LFYGWYIVAASIAINALIGGITVYGFTALVDPIAESFGWSYTQISLAMSIRGAETGTLSPFVGWLVDRWPARWLVFIGVALVGIGYLILSRVANLPMFYMSFLVIGLGSSLGIMMTPTVTIARWFRRNLGKASGLLALGVGSGGLIIPLVVSLVDSYGWSSFLLFFSISVWVIGLPLSMVFRTKPEEYGMIPDGRPVKQPTGKRIISHDKPDVEVKEALRKPAFWFLGAAQMLQMAAISTRTIHVMPYLTSVGIARTTAGLVASAVPLVSLGARLLFGWLADVFPKKYVAASSMALSSVGLLIFSQIRDNSLTLIIAFIIIFGISLGGVLPLRAPLIQEYFGTKKFGSIFGLTRFFTTIGIVIAPPIAGYIFDTRGEYYPTWIIMSGLTLLGAILMLAMPTPSQRVKS